MRDYEREMTSFLQLAWISQQKQQMPPRDKFLILAGEAACNAGWPQVAHECRELVLKHNPAHLIGNHESFVEAMKSDNFATFLKPLHRFCSYEQAEHLLTELKALPTDDADDDDIHATCSRLLWNLSGGLE